MKRPRGIWTTVPTAWVLMLILGATPSSATVLYQAGKGLGVGTTLGLSSTSTLKAETTNGVTVDTCTGASISADIDSGGGGAATVTGTFSKISWGSCTESTTTTTYGSFEIHHIPGTTNGTFTTKHTTWVVPWTAFGVNCVYTAGEATNLGTLTGSTSGNAQLAVNVTLMAENSLFCPDVKMSTNYVLTSPSSTYVEAS